MGRWLQRLREFQGIGEIQAATADTQEVTLLSNTSNTSNIIDPLAEATRYASDPNVIWRVAVLRRQVPTCGPIGRLLVRPDSPMINTIRHCGMCGDPLAEGRRYRCILCQHALWLVLHATVEASGQDEKQHGAA